MPSGALSMCYLLCQRVAGRHIVSTRACSPMAGRWQPLAPPRGSDDRTASRLCHGPVMDFLRTWRTLPQTLLHSLWNGLVAFGALHMPPAQPPSEPQCHPERLRPDIPLTSQERALLASLRGPDPTPHAKQEPRPGRCPGRGSSGLRGFSR
ncbi:DUF6059 family protein [Streptomyces sp. DSM 41524]|uniref:DUF6059 family protein n=1 Tax=Streptomyces asiaticus subsp. ignotus TaxID=3098222 RepID=A0ABU7PSJ4_9ACTN|nr:DUF6059 family protein [Streptomyces sp. DSM 41524]